MPSVAFDTLEASKRLREDGFDEEQANALVHAFAGNRLQGLATRDDVARLRDDLKHVVESIRRDMANMEESIRKDMATLQERPTSRLGAFMIAVLSGFSLMDYFFSPAEPQRRAATVEARLTPVVCVVGDFTQSWHFGDRLFALLLLPYSDNQSDLAR